MKTFFTKLNDKLGIVAAGAFLLLGLYASAAEPFPYGGTLEPNVEYSFDPVELSAVFVPSTTGEISYNCVGIMNPYSDSGHTALIDRKSSSYIGGNQVYTIDVTKDVPVYFYADAFDVQLFANPGENFRITENQPIEVLGYSIDPGSTLSLTSGFDDLLIYFNQGVCASEVKISAPKSGASKSIEMNSELSSSLAINYVSPVLSLLNEGSVEAGDDLVVTVSGISNAAGVYYDNGNDLVVSFKSPAKPVTLLNARVPDPFLAYWKNGDSDAVVTAEYSGNISKAQYLLKYGDFESEIPNGYIEEGSSDNASSKSKVNIDGNKVSIDFAGVQRRPQDMVSNGADYGVISLTLIAWDEAGEPVAGVGQGSVGSTQYELQYLFISSANFNVTFTPESGESLREYENIYVHLYDYEKIQYSGVKFQVENGESFFIPRSEIVETGGPEFDWTLTIPVPAAVRNTSSKTIVTFEDAVFLDREDHAEEFSAIYFGESAGLNSDFYVIPSEGVVKELMEFEVACDNFAVGLSDNIDLNITLSSMADREVIHTFSMADCNIVSTPKPGVDIPMDAYNTDSRYYNVVAKFTLPSPVDAEGTYTLAIPEGFFTFSQYGSSGVTLNSVMNVAYEILGQVSPIEFTATPEPGNVKELSEVVVYFPVGPGIGSGNPQLIFNDGAPVALDATPEFPDDFSDLSMTLRITLPALYTDLGRYEIYFPNGYLLDINGNAIGDMKLTYYIGSVGLEEISSDNDSFTIFTLDGRRIIIQSKSDLKGLERGLYIVNGKKTIL